MKVTLLDEQGLVLTEITSPDSAPGASDTRRSRAVRAAADLEAPAPACTSEPLGGVPV